MPRDSNGNYVLPLAPVAPNTLIEAEKENITRDDIASALTDSLSRNGQGGMTVPLRIVDGTEAQPGVAFSSQTSVGLHRDGVDDMRADVNGRAITRWKGSDFEIRTPIVTPPPGLLANTWYKVLLVGQTIAAGAVAAVNVSVSAIADLVATNVQAALAEIVAGWGKLTRTNTWSAVQTHAAALLMNQATPIQAKDGGGVARNIADTSGSDLYLGALAHANLILQGAGANVLLFNYGSGVKRVWHEGNVTDWRLPVSEAVVANKTIVAADDGKVLVVTTNGIVISFANGAINNLMIICRQAYNLTITGGPVLFFANGQEYNKSSYNVVMPIGSVIEFQNVPSGGGFTAVYGSGLEGLT